MDAIAELSTMLGTGQIDRVLVTHPHTDHIRQLLEIIKGHEVRGEDLAVSRAWRDTAVLTELRSTADPDLLALGYGPQWSPGITVPAEGITHTTIGVGDQQIDVYARGEAHQRFETELNELQHGRRKSMSSKRADSASLLYVFGNENSQSRTAVIGDLRGNDILKMEQGLGAEGFAAALRNVRVISGLGHHFSLTAGETPDDI
jgi:hypothetical protein